MKLLRFCFPALLTLAVSPALAAEYTTTVNGAQYEIWVPDDVDTVYGVWWRVPESGGDTRGNLDRQQYRAFARSQSFAIIGLVLDNDAPASTANMQSVLDDFASQSGHPELSDAVYLLEGYSLGGYRVTQLGDEIPERILCIISGGSHSIIESPTNAKATKIPTLFFRGSDEGSEAGPDRIAKVDQIRANHGYQAAAFIHWGVGHSRGDSLALAFQMWDACTTLRYPEGWDPKTSGLPTLIDIPDDYGWLADASSYPSGFTEIAEAQSYGGDPLARHWLINRDVAFAYRGFSSQDPGVAFTAPNSGTNFELVDPDEMVTLEVAVDSGFEATVVEFFDGSNSIGSDDTAPFSIQWQANRVGAHNIVAVARNGAGNFATGLPLPIIVEGIAIPGGGGLENGEIPDAGSGNGTGDGGINAGSDGGVTQPGSDSGCGCTNVNGEAPWTEAILCCLILAWLARPSVSPRPNTKNVC